MIPIRADQPNGIVLIAIYSALAGALQLVGAVVMDVLLLGRGGVVAALPIFGAAMGAALLVTSYGLWSMKPWGRHFALRVYALLFAFDLAMRMVPFRGHGLALGYVVVLAINGAVLIYLMQASVRARFERQESVRP